MSIPPTTVNARPVAVEFRDNRVWITLADERIIGAPLSRYPWLKTATDEERATFRLGTYSILWELLEDGIDIEGLLAAQPLVNRNVDSP